MEVDTDDEFMIISVAIAAVATELCQTKHRVRRKRRYWIHPIIKQRNDQGDYNHLVRELNEDSELFQRYFRLSHDQFNHVLSVIGPAIRLQNTTWRNAIEPKQQL